MRHNEDVNKWKVLFHEEFEKELFELHVDVRVELFAYQALLECEGPQLGRPYADTLEGSKHANMKELRFKANNGVWRIAFAFDPKRQAILLVGGDKSGVGQKRFYKNLIKKAETRFDEWLDRQKDS